MSSGLSAGAGSYDQEVYADSGSGEGLGVQGGSQDFSGTHSEGLEGGKGNRDADLGLAEGLDGGAGSADNAPGKGFNAGVEGGSQRQGGGVSLDGGAGDVDQQGATDVSDLKDKIKGMGQSVKDKLS